MTAIVSQSRLAGMSDDDVLRWRDNYCEIVEANHPSLADTEHLRELDATDVRRVFSLMLEALPR